MYGILLSLTSMNLAIFENRIGFLPLFQKISREAFDREIFFLTQMVQLFARLTISEASSDSS